MLENNNEDRITAAPLIYIYRERERFPIYFIFLRFTVFFTKQVQRHPTRTDVARLLFFIEIEIEAIS